VKGNICERSSKRKHQIKAKELLCARLKREKMCITKNEREQEKERKRCKRKRPDYQDQGIDENRHLLQEASVSKQQIQRQVLLLLRRIILPELTQSPS